MSFFRDLNFVSRVSLGLWQGLRFRKRQRARAITVFGSARLPDLHPYCEEAKKLTYELSRLGFTIMTGGGGAIMQAANQGAHRAGGESIGINIEISRENKLNPFVKRGMKSRYFFVRKVLLARNSSAFVVFPGGFGTLDELFEIVTLVQTNKADDHPILLMHSDFWNGMIRWCREVLIPAGMITERELGRLKVVNSTAEALAALSHLKA